jgi:hypothetical protein
MWRWIVSCSRSALRNRCAAAELMRNISGGTLIQLLFTGRHVALAIGRRFDTIWG